MDGDGMAMDGDGGWHGPLFGTTPASSWDWGNLFSLLGGFGLFSRVNCSNHKHGNSHSWFSTAS